MLSPLMQAVSRLPAATARYARTLGGVFTRIGALLLKGASNVAHIGYENMALAIYQSTQYTMPENWMKNPENSNHPKTWGRYLADFALFILTTLPGWILGITFIPTFFHTYQNLRSFLPAPTKLLYADRKPEELVAPQFHGGLYGLLGAVLGLSSGGFVALFWLGVRILKQTGKSTKAFWTNLVNWSVQDVKANQAIVKKIAVQPYIPDQTSFEKFLGIFPFGWATSLIFGTLTLSVIGAARFILNASLSTWRNFKTVLNLSVYDLYEDNELTQRKFLIPPTQETRNFIQWGLFGWIGGLLGFSFGSVGFVSVVSARILYNSAKTFVHTLFPNIQWALKGSRLHPLFNLSADRRSQPRYGFSQQLGYPGFIALGPVAISGGALLGVVFRFLNETFISGTNLGIQSLNAASHGVKGHRPLPPFQARRQSYERVIGILGYPLGVLLLSPITLSIILTRYIITNLDTAQKVTRFFTNAASSFHGPIETGRRYSNLSADGVTETVDPNITSAVDVALEETPSKRFFNWMKEVSQNDGRPVYVQLLSFPGALIGTALGGSWRMLIETFFNSFDSASSVLNFALYQSRFQNFFKPIKPHRNTLEIILGSPGYLIGVILAMAPVITIGLVRWVITNGDTANRAFIATVNATRSQDERLPEPEVDLRPSFIRYSTFLGAAIGTLMGFSREVGLNSIKSFRRQVLYLSKKALFESSYANTIPVIRPDSRPLKQQRLGYLGYVLGSFTGSIGYTGITFGRLAINTLVTTYHTMRDMVDFVFLDNYPTIDTFAESRRIAAYFRAEDDVNIELNTAPSLPVATIVHQSLENTRREDQRKNYPFSLGISGFILGAALGLASAWIAGSGRIAWNSLLTAYETILDFADTILPETQATTAWRIPGRKPISKLLGYPFGMFFGIIFGAVVWGGILMRRFVTNTIFSAILVARVMTFSPPMSDEIPALNDPREAASFDRKIGVLGYFLGIPFGMAGFAINFFVFHIPYHSFISAYRSFFYAIFWSMGSSRAKLLLGVEQNRFRPDTRSRFQRILGILGVIGGTLGGGVIASLISLIRIATLNWRLFTIGFKRAANLTWENPFPENSLQLDHEVNKIQLVSEITLTDDQLDDAKYMMGMPGLILGAVAGVAIAAAPVGLLRWIKESGKSYYHLSQSLINVGLDAPYFENGVIADTRAAELKALGSLGYLTAALTTGWVPVISYCGKGLLMGIAVSFSPLVALIKFSYILISPRFKKESQQSEKIAEQKMRELYSALVDGEFPANQSLERNLATPATGGKGFVDFFRKSVTFNVNGLTEDILQEKLNIIRQDTDSAHILPTDVKDRIKKDHRGFFFFTTPMRQKYDAALNQEFGAIDKFVDDYLDDNPATTPEKTNKQPSATELFYYKP